MRHRALIGTIAMLGFIALAGLFAALSFSLSSPSPAHAQTNSAPEFPSETDTRSVDENTPPYQNIGDPVTATDSDDTRLVYTLKNASTSPFTIVRATGQLQVGQPLDYETKSSHTVVVRVTDSKDNIGDPETVPVVDDTITVTITVNNVDDPGEVSLTWTKFQVGVEVYASLTDPDGDVTSETWRWEKSSNGSTWDPISGETSTAYTPVAGDVNRYVRAVASYTDDEGSSSKTARSVAAYVKAVPNPNPAPIFQVDTSGGYSCDRFNAETAEICLYVRGNAPAGSEIYYPASVYYREDAPQKDNDQVRYSLSGTDASLFDIGPLSGDLFTTEAHAYDNPGTDSKFVITIKATDPSGQSDSITVALRPSGGKDNPVVQGPSRITYPENGTWPLAAYSATASSPDRDIHGWIIAVQPGGGDGDFFDIDDDGVLTFTQPPDYEDPADDNGDNTYSFSLHVYDTNPPNSGRPAQTFFNVSVTVVDVSGEVLEIRGPSAVEYPENGTGPVATYRLEGLYGGIGPVDDWSLSGADGSEFDISVTGELTFKRPPDYEAPTDAAGENAYLVTITAYKGSDSKTEFVRVSVTDVNEPPEFDDDLETTLSVDRNTGPNQQIGDPFTATDPDEDASLTYTLSNPNTLPFGIDQHNGQLSTSPTLTQFDRPSYTVTVLVTDGGDADGKTDNSADDRITVTIDVPGAGNDAPEFPSTETGARSFPENPTGVQNVGTPVTATDDDGHTLAYSLGGTDATSFDIDDNSGQIKTKSGVTYDYETKPTYSVTVTATDTGGASATKAVTITLTNVEEDGTVTLSTNQPSARVAITASVTDPDGGVTGTSWQWAKSSTAQGTYTNIRDATSASYTPADGDVGSYLKATASYNDGEGNGRSAEAATTQAVGAGTNRAPEFGATSTTRDVAEDTLADQAVGTAVTANDADDDTLTYSLEGTGANSFHIVSTSGQIQTKTGVTYDYESKPTYLVTVRAVDDNQVTDTISVTIEVTNVNEAGTVTLSNSQPPARVEITATLTDLDGGVTGTSWQWERSSNGSTDWTNVGTNSPSYTPPDADLGYYLRATASYTDGHGPNKSAKAQTTQAVGAGTNRAPDFGATNATRSFPENTAANTNIGSPVEANDPDTGNTLTYSLDATGATSFDIDSASGQIKTKSGVAYDHETTPNYSVTVTAADGNGGTDTIDVTINVTDANDSPEFPSTEDGARRVAENTEAGQPVGDRVEATDQDTGDTLTYSLSGTDASSFTIDSTGQIKVGTGTTLDYEATKNTYELVVEVRDSKDPDSNADTATDNTIDVTINVTDVNEEPEFPSTETGTRNIPENTAAGQPIGDPVEADDPENDILTYSLGGTHAAHFTIIGTSGQLQTKSALDKEIKASYEVTISVHDGKNEAGGSDTTVDNTIDVTITVTEENDPPTVSGQATVSYAENRTDGVATYTANDPEGVTSFTWTLSGDDAGDFSITGGVLTFSTPPNFEDAVDDDNDNEYQVTIEASDGTVKGTLVVTITVTNVNEKPTFDDGQTTTREVAENTSAGQAIGNPIGATDPDTGDTLTYVLGGTDASSFDIDTSNGQLKTKASLDKETEDSYTVTVSVRDSKADDGTADSVTDDTITVNITVTEENDPPEFPDTTTTREVAENTGPGMDIGIPVEATDADNDVLEYTLEGTDKDSFRIVSPSGQIQTKSGETYDHETKDSYSVTVKADDDEGGTDTIAVTITVTDVNEAPKLTGPASIDYAENGTEPVYTYAATDPESDTIIWSLTGADSDAFSIDGGALAFDSPPNFEAPADASTDNIYEVTVEALDGTVKGTLEVTVTVTDVNEAPEFPSTETGARSIAENTGAGQDIGALVTATDPDAGDNLTYTLGGPNAGDFNIEASTGQLRTKADLDYETKSSYSVTVSVSDGRDANGNPDTTTDATTPVTIVVTDVNEQPAFALTTATLTIYENTAPETDIGAPITATDPDNDYTLSYSLEGTDAAVFRINASTGQLQTKGELDFEATPSYSVTVSVHDGKANDGNPDTATDDTIDVTITVTDVEEAGTVTLSSVQPQVGSELTANLDDPDGRVTDITWSWESSSDQTRWSPISGAEAAAYTPVGDDVGDHLRVKATYTDRRGAGKTAQAVSTHEVQAAPLTNDPPAFSAETADRTIPENTAADTNIGDPVTATDPDNDALTYALSGTDSASFDIVQGSGQLKTKVALDHETKDSYTVTVTATDPSGESDEITVTITVIDVNEAPEVTVTPTVYFAENDSGPIATYTATDPDDNTVTWSLLGADAEDFSIREGVLTFKSPPNYEDPADADTDNVYLVTVEASDGTNTVTLDVTVTVTNVEEAGTVTISPEQPRVDASLTATLTDPDGDVSGTTWQWARSSDGSNNWVDIGTDSPSYTTADDDVDKYLRAAVSYTDGQGSGKTAHAVSDNTMEAAAATNVAPDFPRQPVTRTVPENTPAGQDVGSPVAATDPNNDDALTYTLEGTDAMSFDIDSSSGQLQTKAALDYETKNSYEVTVSVRDSKDAGGSADTATDNTIAVTINVTNVEEAGTVTLSPEQPRVGTALTATLTDPDNGVTGETWQWARSSDGSTGWANIETDSPSYTPVDDDVGNYLRATASYADGQGSGKTAQAVSANAVEAAPVTNMAPDFPPQPATRTVPENTGAGQSIGEPVAANDQNAGDTLTYTLGGTDAASFNIVTSSGQLQTKAALNFESKNSYTVTVTAADPSNTSDIITVAITVTDVNEAPAFAAETDTRTIAENTSAGQDIGAPVTATDPDTDATLTYILGGTNAGDFNIDASSGQLQTKAALDYENKRSYFVEVSVRDSKAADGTGDSAADDTITVTVTITNVDEAGTVILSSIQPQVDTPLTATLEDPDGSVSGETWVWARFIDPNSGWTDITGATSDSYTPVDDDLGKYLRVTVSYTDGHGSGKSAREVSDNPVRAAPVNNAAPAFSDTSTTRSVAENTVPGTNIGDPVAATDSNSDPLTYTLSGTDSASFDIVQGSGQLKTKVALDRETKQTYTVTVTAADPSNLSDTITVTITVSNVNEAPVIGFAASIDYAENRRDRIATYTATDPEQDAITWSLSGDDSEDFFISGTGELTFNTPPDHEAPADADTNNRYEITVQAFDGTNTSYLPLTITVTDVNEAPAFPVGPHTRTIAENTEAGENIGAPVAAVDPDADDTLIYTLGGTDAASFDIIASSGQLQTKGALDYETKPSYSVEVSVRDSKAADGTGDSAADDTITVTVTITNVDEAGTVILSSIQPQVDTPLTATLEDPDDVRSVTWRWERPSNKGSWDPITSATSASYTPVAADVGDHLRATASYTDGHGPGKSAQAVSDNEVRAAPVTNAPPTFSAETADRTIAENTTPDTNIGNPVTATDPDTDDRDKLTYKLGGTDAQSFSIVAATGQLQTKAALDHETKQTYTVTVTAADPSGESDTITVTITVSNVNEAPVIGFAASIDYAENRSDRIATYTATDPEQDAITWSLSGDDSEDFFISGTGELTFNTPPNHEAPADADTNNRYEITVQASDGTNTGSLPLTITVTNIDEAPELTGKASITYAENNERPVATYTATDPENGEITWSLLGDDRRQFSISDQGVLTFKALPDYDAPADAGTDNIYEVTVKASDGTNTDTLNVTITVIEANDPPVFPDQGPTPGDQNDQTRNVAENTAAGQNIGAPVAATDDDSDTLTYSLGGADAASFAIVETSGQLQTKAPLDYETKSSYTVTVIATDPSDASATVTVTINVTNEEEPGAITLSPLQPQVGAALTATLVDPDGDVSGATWQWASSSDPSDLTNHPWTDIDGATLNAYTPVAGVVDNFLRVTASYTDPQGSGKTAQAESDNAVVDEPNRPPAFPDQNDETTEVQNDQTTREVAENTAAGQNIGDPVTATDPDTDDTLTYSLGGTDAASFDIEASSGQLKTKAALDYESKDSYTVTVSVRDSKDSQGNADTATDVPINVTINVTNVDEAGTVALSTPRPQVNTELTATLTDPDGGVTGRTWQWASSSDGSTGWANIGTDSPSYTPVARDVSKYLRATASYTDVYGSGKTAQAVSANAVQAAPPVKGGSSSGSGSSSSSRSSSSSSGSGGGSYSPPVNNPPVFTEEPSAERSVAENTAVDRNIGDPVTATDPDKDPLTYALGGADSASFTIDEDSGQLKTKAVLDFESKFTYTVTVTADDGKNGVAAIDVTIDVTDVVEAPINNPETVSQPFTQVPVPLPAAQPVTVAPVVIVNEKGDLGSQGPLGRQGQQGEAGSAGVSGPQGRPGQQGQRGEAGPDGVAGLQGPQGPRGSAGPPGYNGSSGVDGPRGLTGEQGPHGDDASTRTKYIALIVAVVTLPLVLLLWAWDWLRTPNRPRNRRPTGRGPRPTQTGRPAHPHGEGPE